MNAAEFVQLTTIRIETEIPNGKSTGTGFFLSLKNNKNDNTHVPVIVTNKHVVKNAIRGKLRFSLKDTNGNQIKGQYFDLTINDFEKLWIMHPESNIDLCILPIANIHREIQKANKDLFYTMMTVDDIPSSAEIENEFSRIEDITVVGYPDGIWDAYNNMPITRRGITATPLHVDFENAPRFLIDAAIYGGSSGSPVFVFNQGSYTKPDGGLYAGTRLKLVGVVYAVAQHKVTGDIEIVDIPAAKTPISSTLIPNNLGVVIHARKLLNISLLEHYRYAS